MSIKISPFATLQDLVNFDFGIPTQDVELLPSRVGKIPKRLCEEATTSPPRATFSRIKEKLLFERWFDGSPIGNDSDFDIKGSTASYSRFYFSYDSKSELGIYFGHNKISQRLFVLAIEFVDPCSV